MVVGWGAVGAAGMRSECTIHVLLSWRVLARWRGGGDVGDRKWWKLEVPGESACAGFEMQIWFMFMKQQHGAAEARRAHNPEVPRSKRGVAILFRTFSFVYIEPLLLGSPGSSVWRPNPHCAKASGQWRGLHE